MARINDTEVMRLSLQVSIRHVPLFFQLLGHGFCIKAQTGCSVKELLCDQLGIQADYLEQRIQTIFLNGKVVDDVNSAIVQADAILALSGAMPGLVGAILRSGGYYAPMRSQISYDKKIYTSQLETGKVTLKLLNLVVKELGPGFLQLGIRIKAEDARSFIKRYWEDFKKECTSAELDGESITLDQIPDITWHTDQVILKVNSND